MGDSKLVLNDPNFLPMQEVSDSMNQNDSEMIILNSTDNLSSNDVSIDLLSESEADKIKEKEESLNNSAEEEHVETVESPTIGESYVYKCIFCERILAPSDDPKLLKCLHNACGNCVNIKLCEQSDGLSNNKGHIECTQCGLFCEADEIIENQFLLELSSNDDGGKVTEIKVCSSCSDNAVASSWCVDCSEFICDSCVQAHQRLKITKDHTIKPMHEANVDNQSSSSNVSQTNLFCSTHPHEKLSLFCENCDKLTCRDCQLIKHRDHKYKFTHEIASDARKLIGTMLKDVSYKRVLLNSAMKVIADRQNLIADKKQTLVKEITSLVVKLTNTINIRGKQLVARLNEVCDGKQKTLQEKKEALEQLSKMTDHCINFTQHALDNGSDMALLFSKSLVTTHLQTIKSRRADIPNPEIPVRIHLALDKVPELIKVISTIGQIVVDGRVYPPQTTSPAMVPPPPHGSPSPGSTRPNQQQSPVMPVQQQSSSSFPPPTMPPAYGSQHYRPSMSGPPNQVAPPSQNLQPQQNFGGGIIQQNPPHQNMPQSMINNPRMHQNISPNVSQNMGLMTSVSVSQQFPNRIPPRPPMQRPMMPVNRLPSPGINHQQQVTSSTHPQQGNNLRGLLQQQNNPNTVYVQTGPSQYQAVQPAYAQQYQNRYPNQPYRQHSAPRMLPPQQQQQQQMMLQQLKQQQQQQQQQQHQHQQQQQQHHQQQQMRAQFQRPPFQHTNFQLPQSQSQSQSAKWHIPQANEVNTASYSNSNRLSSLPTLNENFKITLRAQNSADNKNPSATATVSSTIPKTPSPNHVQGRCDTERSLDKFCEESVKDLMATIAKLDSNGVQVLAENRPKTGGSPHVDSSTDDNANNVDGSTNKLIKTDGADTGKDDPNEDWCAVCMDGGELVCCDKCPKVFHQYCHIPNLTVEESETWQCLLCMNFADIPDDALSEKKEGELSSKERKICERIVLELYCQYEPSLPFREVVGPEHVNYHTIIKKPIALDTIRQKLDWNSEDHYRNMEDLIKDIRLVFKNAYTYNAEDTQVYHDAQTLEKFFEEQLEKWLPEYAYSNLDDDDDVQPPNKKYKRIICD